MAEIVEFRIERSITELEQLERYGLLTNDEIKAVIKKRKAFEYKLQRNTRIKEDYLKYIAYEESLLKLLGVRRDKMGLHSKTVEIENLIVQHIQTLYRTIVFKNQLDVQLWLSFIDFNTRHKSLAKISSLYSRMLSVLNNKDWLWVRAAKFEFEVHRAPQTARSLLQRGIRFNPESRLLWHQYFKMELMYCQKIRKRREVLALSGTTSDDKETKEVEECKDEVLNGKIASIVYQNAILAFDDFDFAADFLPICSEFDHKLTESHKNMIYDDLKLRFGSREELWDLLAKRMVGDAKEEIKSSSDLTKDEKKKKKKEFERKAIGLYEQKILEFNNEKIWDFYIKYRLEQLSKSNTPKKIKDKLAKVLDLIQRAWNQNLLSIDMFKEWIKLHFSCSDKYDNKNKIKQILLNGCDRWTDTLDVWYFCIPFVIKIVDSKHEIKNFFEKILHKFNRINDENVDKIIEIWDKYMEWSAKNLQPIEIMNITKKLSKMSADKNDRKLIGYMRPRILDALNSSYGLDKARHYYHSFKKTPPLLLSFHQKMLEIETNCENINHHLVRSIHEEIVS